MRKATHLMLSLGLLSGIFKAYAVDLLQVYQQAQASAPSYKEAKSEYMSERSKLAQGRSGLLPNLELTGSWDKPTGGALSYRSTLVTGLSLTQNLFDWNALKKYQEIKLSIKSAAAAYGAAEEALLINTSTAYFKILADEDALRYADANKRQLYHSLKITQQRYHVGLEARASVYKALADYDKARVDYIEQENQLAQDKEGLYQITGQLYFSLARLKENFPLIKPSPASIAAWTKAAQQQNLQLMAANYKVLAAKEEIKAQFAQHLPTLSLNGQYNFQNPDQKRNNLTNGSNIGVKLTMPLYKGGLYTAQTRQATYDYQTAVAKMDEVNRQSIADVRNAYLGVLAMINKIQADRQAIKSATASLSSNQAGYEVGTKTIVDVLTAQTELYKMQLTYVSDRYKYITDTFKLKKAAGILSANDLRQVNHWLTDAPRKDTHSSAQYQLRANGQKRQNVNMKMEGDTVEKINSTPSNSSSAEIHSL